VTVAVVTGGSRGIGAAIVERLASEGMAVVCTATSLDRAAAAAESIGSRRGFRVMPLELHVEDASQVRDAFGRVRATLGPLGLLVNNAGVTNVGGILEADLGALSDVVDVNLKGVLHCTQAAARLMVEAGAGGAIVNLGSVGGRNGFPGRGAYGATKAAVHHLTKIMAIELAGHGIRVNCVAPGFVETDMVKRLAASGVLDIDALKRRTPLGELIGAEDIAATVSWLASPVARFITGETVLVDGGWTAYGHL
jgi:NAD(P)-dependent dehydrogenase (short-subunit alcohol dehydrogenase family)